MDWIRKVKRQNIIPEGIFLQVSLAGIFLVLTTYAIMSLTNATQSLDLHNGLGVCLKRVSQSFNSLALNKLNTSYLQGNFFSQSEDCLAEANKIVEKNISAEAVEVKEVMNKVASDTYWFHKKIVKMVQNNSFDSRESNLIINFQEIEKNIEKLQEFFLKRYHGLKNYSLVSFVFSLTALLLFALSFVQRDRVRNRKNKQVELLEENSGRLLNTFNAFEVQTHFDHMFNVLGLSNTKVLWENFLDDFMERSISSASSSRVMSSAKATNIPRDENEGKRGEGQFPESTEIVVIEDLLWDLLDQFSDKIQAKGMAIEANISKRFYASDIERIEMLSFIFINALDLILNTIPANLSSGKISLRSSFQNTDKKNLTNFSGKGSILFALNYNIENSEQDRNSTFHKMFARLVEMGQESGVVVKLENKKSDQTVFVFEINDCLEITNEADELTQTPKESKNQVRLKRYVRGTKKEILQNILN